MLSFLSSHIISHFYHKSPCFIKKIMILYISIKGELMEIPFNYILINIMINLKNRQIKPEISKQNLIKIIDTIIYNLDYSEKEKLEIINNFDFEYELDSFYNENITYFEITQNNISLNDDTSIEELEDILDDSTNEIILDNIDDLLQTNITIIELMGIKIRKDLYNWLCQSLKEEENLYNKLLLARRNKDNLLEEKIIKQIKIHSFTRKIFFINLENIEFEEAYDLLLYSESITENSKPKNIFFNIKNNTFDETNIHYNPFQIALFSSELSPINLANYKLLYDLDEKMNINIDSYKDDYSFFIKYYYLLCKEIGITPNNNLKKELEVAKYKLMMVIDSMFENTLFRNNDNNNINEYIGNYNSNKLEAYFFIDEILSYKDNMYQYKNSYIIEYFNTIKKLFIETYYLLTKDNTIINRIEQNTLYNKNKISTNYFNSILNTPKRKTHKKTDI